MKKWILAICGMLIFALNFAGGGILLCLNSANAELTLAAQEAEYTADGAKLQYDEENNIFILKMDIIHKNMSDRRATLLRPNVVSAL